jgi:glutaredoxin
MTRYDIYSKRDCIWCERAKHLLSRNNTPYVEHFVLDTSEPVVVEVLGNSITKLELLEMFPNAKTLPIILKDGQMIGGYEDLIGHLDATETSNA